MQFNIIFKTIFEYIHKKFRFVHTNTFCKYRKKIRASPRVHLVVIGITAHCPHYTQHFSNPVDVTAGASPGFGRGGAKKYFFSDLEICMSRSDILRMAKPCALLGGFGGMPPRENFFKWCHLVRFGVYFDHILSLKNFKNYHFFI